jgi:hypothetical protein
MSFDDLNNVFCDAFFAGQQKVLSLEFRYVPRITWFVEHSLWDKEKCCDLDVL